MAKATKTTKAKAKKRLGRGLDGLLPRAPQKTSSIATAVSAAIEELHPVEGQPRRHFDEAALEELTDSIRELGVLEPILVREREAGGFHIVAGERRWRAAQRAGLKSVPIFVHQLSETAAFEAALVENLQREDLNPIETARAFYRLIEDHGHTQQSVAARVGKKRSTVANALRLLKLPQEILGVIIDGSLSEGHGRALLGAPDIGSMRRLAAEARAKGWSVRETERRVRAAAAGQSEPQKKAGKKKSANILDLESRLSRSLGARVQVSDKKGKGGEVRIAYSSLDELDRLLERLL